MQITEFRGKYRFLSNFYPATVNILGLEFPTAEHAFQAAKTNDPAKVEQIRQLATPGEAKKFGKTLLLGPMWNNVKFDIMHAIVAIKFADNPELRKELLDTETATLIEGNTWGDTYWGCVKNERGEWYGQNNLGIILMRVRDSFRHIEEATTW